MCTVHYQKLNGWGKTNPQLHRGLVDAIKLCDLWNLWLLFVGVGFTETKVRQFTERRHASARL